MISEEQKDLSNFIKSVHINLRKKSKLIGHEEAWKFHTKQNHLLGEYAKVMQKLATEYWMTNSQNDSLVVDRVEWIVEKCEEYFKKDLFKERDKEIKKENYYIMKGNIKNSQARSYITVDDNNLSLLDVGSCYNPFKKYPFLNVLPIDLAPASEDVYQSDFLSLKIIKDKISKYNSNIESLTENSFDIVVFSLLLEYLPSPTQRYSCCLKAYELLKKEGLLFIITPDSKNLNANSILMKNWKIALASIGFNRVYYQKYAHIHCMAFRKNLNSEVIKLWSSKMCSSKNMEATNLIKIPQDAQDYNEIYTITNHQKRNENEDQVVAETFNELPNF